MGLPLVFGCVIAIGAAVLGYMIMNQAGQWDYTNGGPPPRPPPRSRNAEDFWESSEEPIPRHRQPNTRTNRKRIRSGQRRNNNASEEQCVICLDDMDEIDKKFTACFHAFHGECIKKWLSVKRACPICRQSTTVS